MIIFILGCHRSGTSALTGMLHSGGIFVGDKLVPANKDNVKGHFEDVMALNINMEILQWLGGNWNKIPENYPDKLPESIESKIEILCNKYRKNHKVWAWKDPRFCLTFKYWRKFLKKNEGVVLHIIRREEEVESSLKKRHTREMNIKMDWRLLYKKYNLYAIKNIRGIKKITIYYSELTNDPRGNQEKIEKFCGIDLMDGYKFIDKNLRHWGNK